MIKRRKPARHQQIPPRPRPPGPQPLETLAGRLNGLIAELQDIAGRVYKYHQDPSNLFDLRELAVHAEARLIVRDGVPLSATYGTGSIWTGRQPPRYLLRLAELAPTASVTTTYLERLADAELTELVEPGCDTTNKSGTPCSAARVRLPDGTRAPACWSHLSSAGGARAAAGKPCTEEGQPTTQSGGRLGRHRRPRSRSPAGIAPVLDSSLLFALPPNQRRAAARAELRRAENDAVTAARQAIVARPGLPDLPGRGG